MNPTHQPQPCPHCHQPTWTGPDAPHLGLPTTTDTTPLTREGEAAALLDGRHTYEITTTPTGKKEINYRDHHRIRNKRWPTIVAQHKCGHPTPPQWTNPQKPKENPHDKPPY